MRSIASAIAWEFRRRHRWGLIAVAGYLLALATFKLLIVEPEQTVTFDDSQRFAVAVIVPGATTFMYLLAVFSFGLAGDLGGRQSIYPARMFTLPVTSAALAGWPMLFGTASMVILWLATRLLGVWPSEFDAPLIWPAVLAAVILAWTQALTWMPYALPGARVIVTVLLLVMIDVVVFVALHYKASETVMLALLVPHLPLAYLTACFAVARARRGDVPDWREVFSPLVPPRGTQFAPLRWAADVLPRRRDHSQRQDFRSPASAQVWFEWRRFGRSLPTLVGILLPFELSLLVVFSDTPVLVFETLLGVLLTPPFMATFVAATVGRPNPHGSDSHGVTPFMASRPLTNASLIAAKLKVSIWSTLATWLLVLMILPLALRVSGTSSVVIDGARQVIEVVGTPRAVGFGLLGLAALVASTWKQLVQSLYIGMSGRTWLVKASVFLALSLLTIIVILAQWVIGNREVIAALWNALPSILTVFVCFKIAAASRIALRLHDSRLLSDRTLVVGAACWDVAVLALYALLVWLVPAMLVGSYVLVLVAILAIPLARLSAAPLALSWNRHR